MELFLFFMDYKFITVANIGYTFSIYVDALYKFAIILLRLQQYKIVEMKLLAQQRDLQVVLFSWFIF